MKEEHKKIIEDIVSKFKKTENGIIHRSDIHDILFPNENSEVFSSVWNLITKNLKLVESVVGENYNFTLTKEGWNFTTFKDVESKELAKELKENLEIDLAKSNLEANKLNKQIAKQNVKNEKKNRVTTWINIGIGIINIGLLIWQIVKD